MQSMKRGSMWGQLLERTSRWSAVALAVFYFNFLAIHLATETHFHGHDHDHAHATGVDHDHDNDGSGHIPHDASAHLLDVALKGADVLDAPTLAIASPLFILDLPVSISRTPCLFERVHPPGQSPPEPRLPRAPPLA